MPQITTSNQFGEEIDTAEIADDAVTLAKIGVGIGGTMVLFPYNYNSIEQGTWAQNMDSGRLWNSVWDNNAASAANDGYTLKVWLAAGTYTVRIICTTNSSSGKLTMTLGGEAVFTLEDLYAAGSTVNVMKQATGITIADNGLQDLVVTIPSKHASASKHNFYCGMIMILRTA